MYEKSQATIAHYSLLAIPNKRYIFPAKELAIFFDSVFFFCLKDAG
jgi:hypothetical protein